MKKKLDGNPKVQAWHRPAPTTLWMATTQKCLYFGIAKVADIVDLTLYFSKVLCKGDKYCIAYCWFEFLANRHLSTTGLETHQETAFVIIWPTPLLPMHSRKSTVWYDIIKSGFCSEFPQALGSRLYRSVFSELRFGDRKFHFWDLAICLFWRKNAGIAFWYIKQRFLRYFGDSFADNICQRVIGQMNIDCPRMVGQSKMTKGWEAVFGKYLLYPFPYYLRTMHVWRQSSCIERGRQC